MEIIVGAIVVAFVLLVTLPRYLRTRRALAEPIGGDHCVACQSTNVITFAPECYRCGGCGFTWGDGMRALAQAQRAQEIAKLSPDDRRALAVAELREANNHLVGADAALEHAAGQLVADLVVPGGGAFGGGNMYSRARNEGVVKAAGEMGMAQKHIRNAAEAMQWRIDSATGPIDFHGEIFALDVRFESILIDIAGHLQVKKLQQKAAEMRQAVAQALAALGQS